MLISEQVSRVVRTVGKKKDLPESLSDICPGEKLFPYFSAGDFT